LQRAGREEEGRGRRELALQITLDSRARLDLAWTLHTHGLDGEALDQFRLALRTLPCGHPEWGAVAEAIGRCLAHDQPAEAAEWLQHDLLNNLRWESSLVRDDDFLHAPSVIHRLRAVAAVRAGDFERADREIDLTLAAMPAALQLAVDLVPLLDQAGRQPQADRLFARVSGALSDQLQHYPHSAMLHHEVASLSARCHRRLEEAFRHAQRAVELEPNNTAYQDTLAETQDQLPHR